MADRCETPRDLLGLIPDLGFAEMENSGRSAICCGNNGFINCDAYSKQIQVERLQEAKATGADLLDHGLPEVHDPPDLRHARPPTGMGRWRMEIRDSGQRAGRSDRMVRRAKRRSVSRRDELQ